MGQAMGKEVGVTLGQCSSCWSPMTGDADDGFGESRHGDRLEVTHLKRQEPVAPTLPMLLEAAEANDLRTVVAIVDSGVLDLDATESVDEYGAVLTAAEAGHLDVVIALAEAGASVETRDSFGRTPLYAAAVAGHVDVVRYLACVAGAEVGAEDHEKRTAFWASCAVRNLRVAGALLATGACDVDARSAAGDTALDFATLHGHAEVAAFLRDRAA